MILKKKSYPPGAPRKAPEGTWDEKRLEHFTKARVFEVQITSVTKRSGFGAIGEDDSMVDDGYEVSGVITFPWLIPVNVRFRRSGETFGTWCYVVHGYTSYNSDDEPTGPGVTCLELEVGDDDGKIREALYEVLKTALLSGRRHARARFFKREGDGAMTTARDREHGYPYGQYPLFGMYCFSEVEATTLANWAVPITSNKFSLENLSPAPSGPRPW